MLVNNIDICRKYLRIAKHVTFDQLSQYTEDFELNQIIEIFGSPFYNAINARYNNGVVPTPALTAHETTIITLMQGAIVRLAFAKAIPKLISSFDGSGLYQASSGQNKSLYEWQKLDLENSCLEDGWKNIGSALDYLFANRGLTEFATWKDSSAEKKSRALFMPSAMVFTEYFNIGSSQRTYEAVKSIAKEVELTRIKPILGETLFGNLKTNFLTAEPTGKPMIAIEYINYAVANYTMAAALAKLEFKVDDEGARVVSVTANSGGKAKINAAGEEFRKAQTIEACKQSAFEFVGQLVEYLNANASDFVGYVVPTYDDLRNEETSTVFL